MSGLPTHIPCTVRSHKLGVQLRNGGTDHAAYQNPTILGAIGIQPDGQGHSRTRLKVCKISLIRLLVPKKAKSAGLNCERALLLCASMSREQRSENI